MYANREFQILTIVLHSNTYFLLSRRTLGINFWYNSGVLDILELANDF